VDIGFTARGRTRTDDSDSVDAAIGVGDKQKALLSRHPDCDEPTLALRVVGIIERFGERIQVNGLSLTE
jgi:hypothetical protein